MEGGVNILTAGFLLQTSFLNLSPSFSSFFFLSLFFFPSSLHLFFETEVLQP